MVANTPNRALPLLEAYGKGVAERDKMHDASLWNVERTMKTGARLEMLLMAGFHLIFRPESTEPGSDPERVVLTVQVEHEGLVQDFYEVTGVVGECIATAANLMGAIGKLALRDVGKTPENTPENVHRNAVLDFLLKRDEG